MKLAYIAKHRSIWPAAWLCEALRVSRSGFHAWFKRSPSEHARYNDALLDKITQNFKSSHCTYDARRVCSNAMRDLRAAMKKLAHRGSLCDRDNNTPSHSGIKHLGRIG